MGYIHIIRDFYSYPEQENRVLRIFTPVAYDHEPDRRFPVLYMHDGQNVFNHPESATFHTWCANDVMEDLAHSGVIRPWIIVAIDHSPARFEQYTPWDDLAVGVQARGHLYTDFLVNHVKPFIDRTYRTLPEPQDTAVAGASLGGLMSVYMGWMRPDVFGRIGGISPSLMWSQAGMFSAWTRHTQRWTRITLEAGEHEMVQYAGVFLDYGNMTRDFYWHLKNLGYADHEVRLVLEPDGQHHEIDWRRRLPGTFSWLLAD